jgi:putative transcriptional regulator
MSKTHGSEALAAIHRTVEGLRAAGLASKRAMDHFDGLCLVESGGLSPVELRRIRLAAKASRADFARRLGVSPHLVGRWERGEAAPDEAATSRLSAIAKERQFTDT